MRCSLSYQTGQLRGNIVQSLRCYIPLLHPHLIYYGTADRHAPAECCLLNSKSATFMQNHGWRTSRHTTCLQICPSLPPMWKQTQPLHHTIQAAEVVTSQGVQESIELSAGWCIMRQIIFVLTKLVLSIGCPLYLHVAGTTCTSIMPNIGINTSRPTQ